MGIFSDHVREFFEHGLICIPVGDKKQPILGAQWQLYCDEGPSDSVVDAWEKNFFGCDKIGLCLGKASGLVAFDFDYAYDPKRVKIDERSFAKDLRVVESHLLRMLPPTPAIKTGKKGWTRFYKWSPELDSGSNLAADRNGIRLFDFLSWHKQTILPPSLHSIVDGSPLHYKWLGPSITECLDDIPPIELSIVLEIKKIFGTGGNAIDNSRHGRLFSFVMKMSEVEPDFDKLCALLIAKDIEMNGSDPKGCYLADPVHFRSGSKIDNAKAWASRILNWKSAKKELGEPTKVYDAESWAYFFEKQFPILRKDILSKKVFIKRDETSVWTDIIGLEGVLKCNAGESGLPRTHVKEQLEKFVFEKKREDFLCELPAWDGVDRVESFGRCIESPDFTPDEMVSILKHWGSGVFRRIHDDDSQNRCLILKGGQGLGKDSFVKSMFKDFKPYFDTTNLSGTPKDVYEIISRLFVLHIEEFEQTAKLDVAFIKSIITQSSAFFRESYGRTPDQKRIAVSFVSTTNRDDILRDPTGNRRFIVVPVEKILWKYPRDESMQVVAQFRAHFVKSECDVLSADLERKILTVLDRYTPPDPNETIIEMYEAMFDNLTIMVNSPFPGRTTLRASEIQLGLREIARGNDLGINRIKNVLQATGFSRRENKGSVYYRVKLGWLSQ